MKAPFAAPSGAYVRSNDSSSNSLHSLTRKNSLDDTAALIAANPSGSRSRPLTTPSPHGMKAPFAAPSPTVNTKEAMAMMQQLWSKPVGEVPSFVAPADKTPTQPQQQSFEIFSDPTSEGAFGGGAAGPGLTPVPIYSDREENIVPFPIFCDDSGKKDVKAPSGSS